MPSTNDTSQPTRASSSFVPFSSSVGSVDDAPAGGRAGRMCRPQRIRPSCCCSHSSRYTQSHNSNCPHPTLLQHQYRCDSCGRCYRHFHCCYCHRPPGSSTAMPSENADAPLPAPPAPAPGTDEQRPKRRTLWQALRKNCHWKCFVLTLMIDGCLAIILWCQWTQRGFFTAGPPLSNFESAKKSTCEHGYNFIPVAFAVMLYVVYIMECWHCRTRLDLLCKTDTRSVYDYISQLREALPVVWWRAVCYHYVRRTRQVTRYRNGDAVTSTQVYYERINSHTAGSAFSYQDCGVKDISKKLIDLERFPVTRLRFRKGFVFANLQAANEFEEQRARFFQENEQRDDYMEVREGLDLINVVFKENMVVFSDPSRRPWFIAQPTFWLFSLLLLSWPLRVLIEYRTAYVNYQVTKLFGTNYLSPSSQNYTGPLTRVSTMDSRELESVLRNNYVIVPSYSEALLMDPVQSRTAVSAGNGAVHIQTRPAAIGPPLDGSRFVLPRPIGGHPSGAAMLSNERVISNYGALMNEEGSSRAAPTGHRSVFSRARLVHPGRPTGPTDSSPFQHFIAAAQQRSRSLSFLFFRTRSSSSDTPGRSNNSTGMHSISIGSLAAIAKANIRRPYRTLPTTPDVDTTSGPVSEMVHLFHDQQQHDEIEDIPEEPPPSYDLALQLCQPVSQPVFAGGNGSAENSCSDRIRAGPNFGQETGRAGDGKRKENGNSDSGGEDTML